MYRIAIALYCFTLASAPALGEGADKALFHSMNEGRPEGLASVDHLVNLGAKSEAAKLIPVKPNEPLLPNRLYLRTHPKTHKKFFDVTGVDEHDDKIGVFLGDETQIVGTSTLPGKWVGLNSSKWVLLKPGADGDLSRWEEIPNAGKNGSYFVMMTRGKRRLSHTKDGD
jgi:hypothetical protein